MVSIINKKLSVSVIVDTYNHAEFIEEAIDSVLNQTFPQSKMEILVVDDGSTDETSEKVKKYKDKIKYIHKGNGGQASAFNVGFKHAQGEYLVLLDADDLCMPERIEKAVNEFENHHSLAIVLNSRHIVGKNIDIWENHSEYHNLKLTENTIKEFTKCSYGSSRTSLRKSIVANILPIPECMKLEADLYLLSILAFGNLSCLKEHLTLYRVHSSNLFHTSDINKIPLKIESIKAALDSIPSIFSKNSEYSKETISQLLLPYQIELKQLEFANKVYISGNAKSRDFFKLELQRLKFFWRDWPFLYKVYKIMQLPFLLVLPPSFLFKILQTYKDKKLYLIRQIFFPNRS